MSDAKVITKEYLKNLFNLDDALAEKTLKALKYVEYKNGDIIVAAGDPGDSLYFIEDGEVDVLDDDDNIINQIFAGAYFGEYGVIANEPRLSTCRARGKVIAFCMEGKDFLSLIGAQPSIASRLLKQVYEQLAMEHSKLLTMARKSRGVIQPAENKKASGLGGFILTYAAVLVIFIQVILYAPKSGIGNMEGWIPVPLAFLFAFTLWTRRTLEGLILTVMLGAGILYEGHFLEGFFDTIIFNICKPDTATTIFIMALMGSVTALLSGAGGISALKRSVEKRVKTGKGALIAMLCILAMVFIDDYLNLLAASFCVISITDQHKIPREIPAFIGSSATAICSLVPISIWGAYLSGTIIGYFGKEGERIFLNSILYNFASIIAVVMAVMMAFGIFPKMGKFREAENRVKSGGKLWPKGSEKYFIHTSEKEIYGHPLNLLIPIVVLVAFSVYIGVGRIGNGFALDAGSALCGTLLVMMFLYCGQKLMTPKEFMEHVISGIEETAQPIVILLLTVCLSDILSNMGFMLKLELFISDITADSYWLYPAACYILFTGFTLVLGSSWGMYGLGIPIAAYLSTTTGINVPLCIGAVMAAGITGDNLCPYLSEGALLSSAVVCEPNVSRHIRLSCWSIVSFICLCGYLLCGYMTCR